MQENKPVGFSVLQLVVTDKDSSHNGPPFFFSIVSGNDDRVFEVNQQGVLLTSAAIQRKVKDHYLLHVKVLKSVFMVFGRCIEELLGGFFLYLNSFMFYEKTKICSYDFWFLSTPFFLSYFTLMEPMHLSASS